METALTQRGWLKPLFASGEFSPVVKNMAKDVSGETDADVNKNNLLVDLFFMLVSIIEGSSDGDQLLKQNDIIKTLTTRVDVFLIELKKYVKSSDFPKTYTEPYIPTTLELVRLMYQSAVLENTKGDEKRPREERVKALLSNLNDWINWTQSKKPKGGNMRLCYTEFLSEAVLRVMSPLILVG